VDEVDRLIRTFRALAASSVIAKLDILLDLEGLADPRVVPFLVEVLADRRESITVRRHVLRWLRNGSLATAARRRVAPAILRIAADAAYPNMQLEAALALGEFVDLAGVPAALGRLALDGALPIDLRYAAFTSLERAGPTAEGVALMRQLSTDETLGPSARGALSTWRLP
jgi:hypothetical protein